MGQGQCMMTDTPFTQNLVDRDIEIDEKENYRQGKREMCLTKSIIDER